MSNPATQVKTRAEKRSGNQWNDPVTAKYAPMGAKLNPKPNTKWQRAVNLFVRLYPITINRAIGLSHPQRLLISQADIINKPAFNNVKMSPFRGLITPEGISLFAVLGFKESKFRSAHRLKPIAVFLANTIHSITKNKVVQLKE